MARPYCTGACEIYVGLGKRQPTPPAPEISYPTPMGTGPTPVGPGGGTVQTGTGPNLITVPQTPRPTPAKPSGSQPGLLPYDRFFEGAVMGERGFASGQQAAQSTALFLGTAEEYPTVDIIPHYRPINTDAAGGRHGAPEDEAWVGEEAIIQATLTYWNESVFAACAARPLGGAGRGFAYQKQMGTLMLREGAAYTVWVYFPYWSKQFQPLPNLAGPQKMPAGYRFPRCYLIAPERLSVLGSRPRKISLLWRAKMDYKEVFAASDLVGISFKDNLSTRTLYDHDMRGLPGLN